MQHKNQTKSRKKTRIFREIFYLSIFGKEVGIFYTPRIPDPIDMDKRELI